MTPTLTIKQMRELQEWHCNKWTNGSYQKPDWLDESVTYLPTIIDQYEETQAQLEACQKELEGAKKENKNLEDLSRLTIISKMRTEEVLSGIQRRYYQENEQLKAQNLALEMQLGLIKNIYETITEDDADWIDVTCRVYDEACKPNTAKAEAMLKVVEISKEILDFAEMTVTGRWDMQANISIYAKGLIDLRKAVKQVEALQALEGGV